MPVSTHTLQCEMSDRCTSPVAMIEDSGFIYCADCGRERRHYGRRVRMLRPFELRRLEKGLTVLHY